MSILCLENLDSPIECEIRQNFSEYWFILSFSKWLVLNYLIFSDLLKDEFKTEIGPDVSAFYKNQCFRFLKYRIFLKSNKFSY